MPNEHSLLDSASVPDPGPRCKPYNRDLRGRVTERPEGIGCRKSSNERESSIRGLPIAGTPKRPMLLALADYIASVLRIARMTSPWVVACVALCCAACDRTGGES